MVLEGDSTGLLDVSSVGGLLLFVDDSLEFLRPFSLADVVAVVTSAAESEVSELLLGMLLPSSDVEDGCSLLVVVVAVLLVLELDGLSCPKMALSYNLGSVNWVVRLLWSRK